MTPEAPLEHTEHGPMRVGEGWFVLNAREARWFKREGRGFTPALQGRGDFPQLALGPMAMYHGETDQEDFLVLSGEALLIVEGEERPLRQWDFVHCPPGTLEHHTTGSRVDGTLRGTADWGAYTVDEAASRHCPSVKKETTDADEAYARFPELQPTEYRDGWLP